MSGSTKTSLTSLSSHVRHNTDQFTCRGTDNQSPVTESLLVTCLLSHTQKPAESHAVARQLSRCADSSSGLLLQRAAHLPYGNIVVTYKALSPESSHALNPDTCYLPHAQCPLCIFNAAHGFTHTQPS